MKIFPTETKLADQISWQKRFTIRTKRYTRNNYDELFLLLDIMTNTVQVKMEISQFLTIDMLTPQQSGPERSLKLKSHLLAGRSQN